MHIEQVDRHCDVFEQRLKNGEKLSAEQFLQENGLAADEEFLAELHKLQREYRNGSPIHAGESQPPESPIGDRATEPLLPGGKESVIGNYKLLQKIGEGGMGVVYMAEQTKPVSRRVALKVVKPGMDSREILARFEAERQALALMDHPNMARVLDAGTTDKGLPYFAMELVKGIPITDYCDQRQLSLKERLELFLPVCQAVQHAHQKGIIHRDLKPSNVLVAQYDNRPVPKIIDFGLAKAIGQKLTEKTMFTQYGQILGTIDYMSPEQASFNQLDVDTRSDIYSLGVLLYELLSGETPFDKQRLRSAAFDELLRIIRQEEPPRPSTRLSSNASLPSIAANRKLDPVKLRHLMRGELDWIVMKAMDKERDRRYQSASELADDVRRYLEHETVLACPPSPVYRFQKFARRNRALMNSAAAVLATLLLGLAATSWALILSIDAEAQTAIELQLSRAANRRYAQVTGIQQFHGKKEARFDDATCELLNELTTEISQHHAFEASQWQLLQHQILSRAVAFWDQAIAADVDQNGDPLRRQHYYRLQRALCLARLGNHERAYAEAIALRPEPLREHLWERNLTRLYALCAQGSEKGLAEQCVEAAIQHLRRAAGLAKEPPLSPDDRDLVALKSHGEFSGLLDQWRADYQSRGSASAEKADIPLTQSDPKGTPP